MKRIALSLLLAAACGGSSKQATMPAVHTAPLVGTGLQIKLTSIYVDDQAKALKFYTDVLGFALKDDFSNGGYRWLTVSAPGDTEGSALQLALNDSAPAKAYQEALFQQHQPAVMFFTDDLKREVDRITAKGGTFTMPPTKVTGSTIAQMNDTCGNLVQITELAH
jgi:predicted enzyme related to lactoylglutathione lyase